MMSKNCQLGHILLRLPDNPSRNCVKLSWVVQLLLELNPISVAQEKWESWANIASWDIFLLRLPDNPSRNRAELAIIPSCSMWKFTWHIQCDVFNYWHAMTFLLQVNIIWMVCESSPSMRRAAGRVDHWDELSIEQGENTVRISPEWFPDEGNWNQFRLYSNISQILLLYKTWWYNNKFDSTKSLVVRYRCVKIPGDNAGKWSMD